MAWCSRARALLPWAMDDRSTSTVFRDSRFAIRDSRFGETRQALRQGASR